MAYFLSLFALLYQRTTLLNPPTPKDEFGIIIYGARLFFFGTYN